MSSGKFETDWYGDLRLIPAIFIGQAIGSLLHCAMSPNWFRKVTFFLLLATAVNALLQSV